MHSRIIRTKKQRRSQRTRDPLQLFRPLYCSYKQGAPLVQRYLVTRNGNVRTVWASTLYSNDLYLHVFTKSVLTAVKGPLRPYYNTTCFFSSFRKKSLFRSSYTISSIIVACETRLTENGVPPEPNLRMVSLTS